MNISQGKKTLIQQTLFQLEQENSELRQELMEAHAIIETLKQENQALTKRLNTYINKPGKTLKPEEPSKPVSKVCDICSQDIPLSNFDLHQIQCMRKNARCQFCNQIFPVNNIDAHIQEKRGKFEDLVLDIEQGNIESLADREIHGCKFDSREPGDIGNTLLHTAVKNGKREVVQFFVNKGLNLNEVNNFGESLLHVACGKLKDFSMVQFLVSKGVDFRVVNSMGDSAMEVAKRNGFHEAVLYFQQKVQMKGRLMSAGVSRRPGTGLNSFH
jgi:hypothetical protein